MQHLEEKEVKDIIDHQALPKPSRDKSRIYIFAVLIFLAIFTVMGLVKIFSEDIDWGPALSATLENVRVMFTESKFTHFTWGHALVQVLITMGLAFVTTVLSAIVAFFMSLVVAENVIGGIPGKIVRGIVSFIRSIPTVLWVLIFARVTLGSQAAVMGIAFHAIGYLTKVFAESIEELDEGKIEALKASGASFWQIVSQAILPMTLSYFVAWTFMRFEINYVVALAMGAAAGAGGIGYDLFMAGSFYFNVREVGAIAYLVVVTTLILEMISKRIKKSLKVD